MYVYIYISINHRASLRFYGSSYVYVSLHIYIYTSIYLHVYMYVYICMYMCIYTRIQRALRARMLALRSVCRAELGRYVDHRWVKSSSSQKGSQGLPPSFFQHKMGLLNSGWESKANGLLVKSSFLIADGQMEDSGYLWRAPEVFWGNPFGGLSDHWAHLASVKVSL